MPLIRVSLKSNNRRIDVNTAHIVYVYDNGQGQPASLKLSTGTDIDVAESAQSVRGYVKKAEAGSSED